MIDDCPEEGSQATEKAVWTLVPVYRKELKRVEITAKRAVVGAGARVLFYPTLLYNVVRNKLQSEFRWWDEIDQVCDDVPLNERFEFLSSLSHESTFSNTVDWNVLQLSKHDDVAYHL